jgi:hypothetical protein
LLGWTQRKTHLSLFLLLLFLGALGGFNFLLYLRDLVLERSKKLREQTRALGTVFLLWGLSISLGIGYTTINESEKKRTNRLLLSSCFGSGGLSRSGFSNRSGGLLSLAFCFGWFLE